MKDKEKKGFFDFLKNSNVKKLEKMGKTRHGVDKGEMEKAARKSKRGYEDGGVAKKEKKKTSTKDLIDYVETGAGDSGAVRPRHITKEEKDRIMKHRRSVGDIQHTSDARLKKHLEYRKKNKGSSSDWIDKEIIKNIEKGLTSEEKAERKQAIKNKRNNKKEYKEGGVVKKEEKGSFSKLMGLFKGVGKSREEKYNIGKLPKKKK